MPVLEGLRLTDTGHQDIQALEGDLADLRVKRRTTPRKVTIASLPDDLTQLAFQHPETHARLIYQLV